MVLKGYFILKSMDKCRKCLNLCDCTTKLLYCFLFSGRELLIYYDNSVYNYLFTKYISGLLPDNNMQSVFPLLIH